jgi:D-aspartate ligase
MAVTLDKPAPFLLTMPEYAGSLAAARCLGSHGVPVTVAGDRLLAPARWSRHATRFVSAPPVRDFQRFYAWLLQFGRENPGHVLYPTCDDLAWIIAKHAGELGEHFLLYQPEVATIEKLLDKKELYELCERVGIATIPTAYPTEVPRASWAERNLQFPVMLKPRTQILFNSRSKGAVVERPSRLEGAYSAFMTYNGFDELVSGQLPGIEHPMLQTFRPEAAEGIYSLAGFVAPGGRIVARASRKVLQRPRKLGVGLCFEEQPVDAELLAKLGELCRAAGYFGVFEAEFVISEGRSQLLDFNPRFYGQMGFEIGRAMPLAYLCWLGARGDEAGMTRVLEQAAQWEEGRGYVYAHLFFLRFWMGLRRLFGKGEKGELAHWSGWYRDHQRRALAVDAASHPDDRMPGLIAALGEITHALRHPRSFIRQFLNAD